MICSNMSLLAATQYWVRGFNAFPLPMISQLIDYNSNAWHEVTLPTIGDSVFVYEKSARGEIISHDNSIYTVKLFNNKTFSLTSDDFKVVYDYSLPIWATMWAFDDSADINWLETDKGLAAMSDCGFRVYYHDDFGYFFGIYGAGYDFYTEHWIPLYLARGLQWHSDNDSFVIHDSWGIPEVDNLIAVNDYQFLPELSLDDKKQVLLKMVDNYDPDVGYNFDSLNFALLELFSQAHY